MVNSVAIKSKMKEKGVSQKELAQVLKCAQATASQKINNVRPLFLEEAIAIMRMLDIEGKDFDVYFFAA